MNLIYNSTLGGGAKYSDNQVDRLLFKRSPSKSIITENLLPDDVLSGEMILSYETDKERLFIKNVDNKIVPIHNTFNAGEIECNIKFSYTPEEVPNGTWIYCNDGLLYDPAYWSKSNNNKSEGVALVTDNTKLCIKKGINAKSNIRWSSVLVGQDLTEINNGSPDYKGMNNSIAIRQAASSEDETNNATWYCYSQTITINGDEIHGYLPAYSELEEIYSNKQKIEEILQLIGSETITEYCEGISSFWSSTENNGNPTSGALSMYWGDGGSVYFLKQYPNVDRYALPCFSILPSLVDLGLPSGNLWSATNLGAFKPEQGGYYYQWGDTIGWTKEQVGNPKQFASDWSDYKFGSSDNFTKYNTSDNKLQLDLEDDAVNVAFGSNWRIPTADDLQELYDNTKKEWISIDGMDGYKLTSSNGNYIFLPAAGSCKDHSLSLYKIVGFIWSSSLFNNVNMSNTYVCYFEDGFLQNRMDFYRNNGFPVRGIKKKTL